MASVIFKKLKSATRTKLYSATFSRTGVGLGKKTPYTAQQMTEVYEGHPRDWPSGTDRRSPLLPHEGDSRVTE